VFIAPSRAVTVAHPDDDDDDDDDDYYDYDYDDDDDDDGATNTVASFACFRVHGCGRVCGARRSLFLHGVSTHVPVVTCLNNVARVSTSTQG